MSQQVDAIYDSGVLRPLEPLALPDQARVKLTIEAEAGCELVEQTTGVNNAPRDHEEDRRTPLTGAELLKLARAHTPPPEFFDADEDRPW